MRGVAYAGGVGVAGILSRTSAIFLRDAQIATSYGAAFGLQLLGTVVAAAVSYCIALGAGNPTVAGGARYFDYLAVNMAFYGFQSTALLTFAEAIRESQLVGTLEVMLSTPTSIPVLILSTGLWAFMFCGLQTSLFLATAVAFGLNLSHTNVLTVLVFLVLTIACISPLGVLAASVTMVFKKAGPVEFFFNNAALLCGGVFLPVDKLPAPLQIFSWLLPISHALNGLRAGVLGTPITHVIGDVAWLSIASIVLVPLSLLAFARAVRAARVDGTLGSY